jgi:hypothetical protein
MRQVQIYLKGLDASGNVKDFRLDLYKDESIEVTSSIKQAKDIGTIYSDYTQSFTLPASSTNNKVFKHFYNFDISSGYFDARLRQSAFIEINSLPYRKGKMFLSSVNMKNNKPMFYKVVFYGSVASLKDIFADDLLSSLDLTDFNHDFTHTEVKSIFKNGKTVNGDDNALIYPLITSKKRLFYDDTIGNTDDENFDGNLYIPSSGFDIDRYHKRGISEYDLKPAIKLYQLIKAIEAKYDLVLIPNDTSGTKDFFSKHNEAFANLYMWLSSKAGNIYGEEGEEDYSFKNIATGFTTKTDSGIKDVDYSYFFVGGDDDEIINIGSAYEIEFDAGAINFYEYAKFRIRVIPDSSETNIEYRVKLIDIDTGNVQTASGSGTVNYEFNLPQLDMGSDAKRYRIEFSSKIIMNDVIIQPHIFRKIPDPFGIVRDHQEKFESSTFSTSLSKVFLNEQIPEIKIIDFINGLFKMFNLVAFIIDDESNSEYGTSTTLRLGTPNVVKVMTYDDYYADASNNVSLGTIDITKYIDVSMHNVDTMLPFREINFEYEETDIVLIEQHKKIANGKIFGNANNSIESEFGKFFHDEVYDIEVPFSHFKYERLLGTDIQWGYAAGGDFKNTPANYSNSDNIVAPKGNYDSKDVKPLIFYAIETDITSTPINFNDTIDDVEAVTTYFRPSNGNEDSSVSDNIEDASLLATYYLNFGIDLDEWSGATALNSLYGLFYRNYIKMILEQKKRLHQFEAFLPPSFIVNYKLNDQLKIQDTVYRINSLDINLTTGKSSLELINLEDTEIL